MFSLSLKTSEAIIIPIIVPAGKRGNSFFYRVMLGEKGDPLFTQRFRQNKEKRFRSLVTLAGNAASSNAPFIDLRLSCIAYTGVGAIVWWLEQEQPCSPEQLAIWLTQLSSAIAGPSLKPQPCMSPSWE